MSSAPRAGRKGGKIEATALTPPSEVKIARETSEVLADKPSTSSALFDETSSILQFDVDAIEHVAKGVVLGGTRNIRTEKREVQVSAEEVETKIDAFLDSVTTVKAEPLVSEAVLEKLTAAVGSHDVVVAHAVEGLQAAVRAAAANSKFRMLFVAPSIFNLEPTWNAVKTVAGADQSVGKYVGSKISGARSTRLWVTDAKTAVHLLATAPNNNKGGDAAGFSHVVFVKLRPQQPVAQLALLAAKSRKQLKIVFAGAAVAEDMNALVAYVAPKSVFPSPLLSTTPSFPVATLSQEEVCAFTNLDLVHVAIDRSGKFIGPHPRVVDNCMELCIAFLKKLIARSNESDTPQVVVIFTADLGDTMFRIQKEVELADYLVVGGTDDCNATSAVGEDAASATTKKTTIHVMAHYDVDECMAMGPTVVIDKGTIKVRTTTRGESLFPSSRTEWESTAEEANRRSLVGVRGPGMFVRLYPTEAADVFTKGPSQQHLEVVDMDAAILQCSRHAQFGFAPSKLLPKYPADAVDRAMLELSEVGGIVSRENPGFTFLGEILGRLPFWTDMSLFIVLCTTLGFGEVAAVIAAVSAVHLFPSKPALLTNQEWAAKANQLRAEVAGDQARTSDLLADAALFLRWLSLSLSTTRDPTEADDFAKSVDCDANRMDTISMLIAHTMEQLGDYANLDTFQTQEAVNRCSDALSQNWDVLSFVLGAAACRKCAIVRNEGELHARDTSASLMFLRTPKTAAPNLFTPSGIQWRSGNALIATGIISAATHFFLRGVSTIRLSFLFNSILMFHPAVEVSNPQTSGGNSLRADEQQFVYFGITANDQLKRFRVPLEDAAKILDFRQGVCEALGCLQSLRSLPRGTSLSQYTTHLQSLRPSFNLKAHRQGLLNALRDLVQTLEPSEESKSFQTSQIHRLNAVEVAKLPNKVADPSDDIAALALWNNNHQETVVVSAATATPATPAVTTAPAAAAAVSSPPPAATPSSATTASGMHATAAPFVEDDDDVETEQSYFMVNGPMVEDEDEE